MKAFNDLCRYVAALVFSFSVVAAHAQQEPFLPEIGQDGKDVVWMPTSPAMVEKMLDVAKVTPQDFVIDLGSGDGRNIIAAAKRGAAGLGIEYNADLVALSNRLAREAGVADKASFVEGDMYDADISKATVLALYLLPANLERLRPKFLDMRPGSRIVANLFAIPDWIPDHSEQLSDCVDRCQVRLWIVPAKVAGTWRLPQGELKLEQQFQMLTGKLREVEISEGRLRGNDITFRVGSDLYQGRVSGNRMEGLVNGTPWSATQGP